MILVTGAAGYIGSHTVDTLLKNGRKNILALDNLYSGFRWAVPSNVELFIGNCGDIELLNYLFKKYPIEAVIHFAAHLEVEESTRLPSKYYRNNCINTLNLIETAIKHNLKYFIFSSTCAVYGTPSQNPVHESTAIAPLSPYGKSKLSSEWIIRDLIAAASSDVLTSRPPPRFSILRYFNVAGAKIEGGLGQATANATQLIKVAAETAVGKRKKLKVFGTDYPTKDGTCIRDYIHVQDLAEAHFLALEYLERGGNSEIFNCGYGHGVSVSEVVSAMKKISAVDFEVEYCGRRAGDSVEIFSDSSKIKRLLSWYPKHANLELICKSSLSWEKEMMVRGI